MLNICSIKEISGLCKRLVSGSVFAVALFVFNAIHHQPLGYESETTCAESREAIARLLRKVLNKSTTGNVFYRGIILV